MTLDFSVSNLTELNDYFCKKLHESVNGTLNKYGKVTPGAVLSALRLVLYPLLSEAERIHLREIDRASWWNLYWLFPAYAFMAGPHDLRLQRIASVIHRTVATHADPRTVDLVPIYQEVGAFRQMRDQTGAPLPDLCHFNERGHSWLYRFCRYCWRHALPSGLLCAIHSPAKDVGSKASYQEGRRMYEEFNAEIVRIITRDALEFHEQAMSLSVLHWPDNLEGWLRQYRPRVAEWLGMGRDGGQTRSGNLGTLQDLIAQVQGATIASVRAQNERSAADKAFCEFPELLWPVWVRAEAWLVVRNRRNARWGGARSR